MNFIAIIEGAHAWIYQRGVYKQAQLYRRGDSIYAKWGGGYIRLRADGATSIPTAIWKDIDAGEGAHISIEPRKEPLLLSVVEIPAIAAE